MGQAAQQSYFDSLIGREINNRYKLETKIGSGAMGAVFRATDLQSSETVAIKVISPDLANDEKFIKRFEREGELGKLLNHPNIVRVEEFGATEGLFFIAMEFVAGDTLKSYLNTSAPCSPNRTLELLTQLCGALDFAHKHNVLHRDLKPENILMTRNSKGEEVLKLADFGIAKRTDLSKTKDQMLTVEGEIFGTPHYMSPEQVLAQKLKPTTDVYSIGVMLYQMLSGKLPLEHSKAQQLLILKISQDVAPISKTFPFVSPIFDPILKKALSRTVTDRYQSAGELLEAFADALKEFDPNFQSVTSGKITNELPDVPNKLSNKEQAVIDSKEVESSPQKSSTSPSISTVNNKATSQKIVSKDKAASQKISIPIKESPEIPNQSASGPNWVLLGVIGVVLLGVIVVIIILMQ